MSTTFGVKIPSTDEIKPVARRKGIGNGKVAVWFTEPIAELLPHKLEVIPMDNSAQGIHTIGDIVLAASNAWLYEQDGNEVREKACAPRRHKT